MKAHPARRWAATAAAAAMLGAVTACGTTVPGATQVGGSAVGGAAAGSGLAPPAASGNTLAQGSRNGTGGAGAPAGVVGGGVAAGRTDRSGAGSVSTGSGTATTTGSGAGPAKGSAAAVSGPGFDAKTVAIGFVTQQGATAAAAAAGANQIDYGDSQAQAKAVVAALNKRGGVLGRKIVPVFYDVKTSDDRQTSTQAACTRFTQDARVVSVVNTVAAIDKDNLYGCLAKQSIPIVSASNLPSDTQRFRTYPSTYYTSTNPALDAVTSTWVNRLGTLKYFTGWNAATGSPGTAPVKTAVIYPDTATGRRLLGTLKAALKRAGFAPDTTAGYDATQPDFGTGAVANAVLTFRQAGVTHVFSIDGVVQVFMSAADQQGYRPRYALNSYVQPQLLQQLEPASQLNGSIGIGWQPGLDVDAAHDPGKGPGEAACKKVMKDAGQDLSNRAAELVALATCDGFELFADAMNAGGGFSATAIQAGAERLRGRLPVASVFLNGIAPGRHWIPGVYRDLQYVGSCSCFQYLNRTNQPL